MKNIRQARKEDISRIAEILVFVKRINFLPIFKDYQYSFKEQQVLNVASMYMKQPELLEKYWVYDDGIVKGFIHIEDQEVAELYVDAFFQNEGIGGQLLDYALDYHNVQYLWALEKNVRAITFYERHGLSYCGEWKYEADTQERLIKLAIQYEELF